MPPTLKNVTMNGSSLESALRLLELLIDLLVRRDLPRRLGDGRCSETMAPSLIMVLLLLLLLEERSLASLRVMVSLSDQNN